MRGCYSHTSSATAAIRVEQDNPDTGVVQDSSNGWSGFKIVSDNIDKMSADHFNGLTCKPSRCTIFTVVQYEIVSICLPTQIPPQTRQTSTLPHSFQRQMTWPTYSMTVKFWWRGNHFLRECLVYCK